MGCVERVIAAMSPVGGINDAEVGAGAPVSQVVGQAATRPRKTASATQQAGLAATHLPAAPAVDTGVSGQQFRPVVANADAPPAPARPQQEPWEPHGDTLHVPRGADRTSLSDPRNGADAASAKRLATREVRRRGG